MELIKDYDCTIEYHPGKANVVADALSRKSTTTLSHLEVVRVPLLIELRATGVQLGWDEVGALLASFHVRPTLLDRLREAQLEDVSFESVKGIGCWRFPSRVFLEGGRDSFVQEQVCVFLVILI